MRRMQSAWFCQSVLTPCGAKLERGICKWSKKMVDLVGIEPTTSSMPWKRAPSCATGPRACSSILADWDEIVKPKALVRVQQIKGSIFSLNGTNRLILRLVYGEQVRLLAALPTHKICQLPTPQKREFRCKELSRR